MWRHLANLANEPEQVQWANLPLVSLSPHLTQCSIGPESHPQICRTSIRSAVVLQGMGAWRTDRLTDTSRYIVLDCNSPQLMHSMHEPKSITCSQNDYILLACTCTYWYIYLQELSYRRDCAPRLGEPRSRRSRKFHPRRKQCGFLWYYDVVMPSLHPVAGYCGT